MIIKTKNIGQETGVYDKYGIPIKIGHIVTWHSGDPKISSEVGYVHTNGEEIWFQYGDNKWSCTTEAVLTDMPPEQLEVIGDVVNNLNLLTWMKECPNQLAWAKQDQQEGSNSKYEQKTIICQSTDKNDVEEFDKTCTQMVKDGWRTIDLLVVEGKLARVFYLSEVERAIKKYN